MAEPPVFGPRTPLPSREEIARLWNRYGMLDNIREHSRVVTAVALLVTDWLAQAGTKLNRRAVEAGALLHDIAKTPCLGTETRHDRQGEAILAGLGYPELGYLVRNHVVLPPEEPLDETMLVNYADKRVNHDQLVDLADRFAYIAGRYGRGMPHLEQRIAQGLERAREVERLIFERINHGRTPADILRALQGGA
ncbi:MAG: HD domain-containing protein [Desulfarculus sp.]|nr:MAG: HD domain-containing protein [Desulfarculus sp.]